MKKDKKTYIVVIKNLSTYEDNILWSGTQQDCESYVGGYLASLKMHTEYRETKREEEEYYTSMLIQSPKEDEADYKIFINNIG